MTVGVFGDDSGGAFGDDSGCFFGDDIYSYVCNPNFTDSLLNFFLIEYN